MDNLHNNKGLNIFFSSFLIIFFSYFLMANDDLNNTNQEEKIIAKVLYVDYSKIPKIVYTKQRFSVTIHANILISKANIPYTVSTDINEDKSNVILISDDIVWDKIDDNNYEATLHFKVTQDTVVLPLITISLYDETNNIIDSSKLKDEKILYRKIAINQNKYSNILAKDLEIKSIKTKQYTNKELIHSIAITAKNSNLEEFKLKKYEKQGIKALNTNDNIQMLYYFIITPRSEKNIAFNYFNTSKNKFIDVNIPITIEEELVSTQTDLNPYENDMIIYKRMAIAVVVLFFLMIYFFKREFFFLFFAVLFMTLLVYMMWPNKKITIKTDTKVYILPTSNSTVFKVFKENKEVEVLIKKEYFSKILFDKNKIGWIKNNG